MQADTIKRLRELPERLRHAAATEMNDDYTEPMSEKRLRMTARVDAMLAAGDAIEELLAIAEGAEADRALLREAREVIADDAASMRECESVDGVVTDPAALPEIERLESIVRRIDAALAGAVQGEG